MARPIIRRVFLTYSGDARYLQYLIKTLQSQLEDSHTLDVKSGLHTATAKVELNIPGLSIEWETEPVIES